VVAVSGFVNLGLEGLTLLAVDPAFSVEVGMMGKDNCAVWLFFEDCDAKEHTSSAVDLMPKSSKRSTYISWGWKPSRKRRFLFIR
jgi:hypothetical protein